MDELLTIPLLHGCNLDMLGKRDPAHYGAITLDQLESETVKKGRELGMHVQSFQTNYEGALVEKIHEYWRRADGMIINPGAWTHYSYAIRDALEMVESPVIEVHISDISRREEWRRRSVIREVCAYSVSGKGLAGYTEALEWLSHYHKRIRRG